MAVKLKRVGRGRAVRRIKSPPVPAQPFVQHSFEKKIEFVGGGIPMVLITREAYSRMWHYVDIAPKEVGWLGTVRVTPYGNYLIEEVFLPEQEVSFTETELSGEGQAQLAQDLIDTRPDGVEVANRLRFWGHSHVKMGTSPSPEDNKQMTKFRENGCPWFIRGILNKLGRMEFTIFLWGAGVKIVDAPWAICENIDQSMRAGIETEFKKKVSEKTYPPVGPLDVNDPLVFVNRGGVNMRGAFNAHPQTLEDSLRALQNQFGVLGLDDDEDSEGIGYVS
ncbi:MAG: hypothetical protein Q8L52_03045 [bacterium]|nr:hypothetical protein [bacterium]